jgi:hypothetical protein
VPPPARPAERPSLGAFVREAREPAPPPPTAPERHAEPEPEPPAAAGEARPLTRDDLVAAWGDHVLATLRPKAKSMYTAGRFLGVDGNRAVFGLPNAAHVQNAQPQRKEVAAALSRHFGQRVELSLEVDPGPPATAGGGRRDPAAPDDDEYLEELLDRDDPGTPAPRGQKDTAVSLAADRLLQAFPGAEEIQP